MTEITKELNKCIILSDQREKGMDTFKPGSGKNMKADIGSSFLAAQNQYERKLDNRKNHT